MRRTVIAFSQDRFYGLHDDGNWGSDLSLQIFLLSGVESPGGEVAFLVQFREGHLDLGYGSLESL